MKTEEYEDWLGKPTRDINKKCNSNRELLDEAIKSAGARSDALKGNATSFNVAIHEQAVKKFQEIGNKILALIDIMTSRQGLAELVAPGDLVINQSLANSLAVMRTEVATKTQVAQDKVRAQLDRFNFEKAKHQAEIKEKARLEVANARTAAEVPTPDLAIPPPAPHFNRIVRFQPTESSRKPEIMDIDDDYGSFFDNIPKMEALYRDAAVPEGFTPESQQQQFMRFVSPTLAVQLKQRLEKIPNAT